MLTTLAASRSIKVLILPISGASSAIDKAVVVVVGTEAGVLNAEAEAHRDNTVIVLRRVFILSS